MDLTYDVTIPMYGQKSPVNDTSQRWNLTIDRDAMKSLNFFINGIPSSNPNLPSVSRGELLQLQAIVLNETGGPIQDEIVEFFNYTGGDVPIGTNVTNASGIATINIIPGINSISGPNLLYAKLGNRLNYSYYILNEAPTITIISGPTPLVINKTNNEQFNFMGYLNDSINLKPLANCDLILRIFKGGIEYTSNLTGSDPNPFQTDNNGRFDITFGVHADTPPGNYTLRLDFNGSYALLSNPYYPYDFNLPYINTSTQFSNELQVTYQAPLNIYFWINGIPSGQTPYANITRNGVLYLTAQLLLGSTPLSGYSVNFYDITNKTSIGNNVTDAFGHATYQYNTNMNTIAGPHIIFANCSFGTNYSFYILNAPINVSLIVCPSPLNINNTGSIGRSFYILGNLIDGTNGAAIQNGTVEIILDNNPLFDNDLIPFVRPQQHENYFDCNETGEIYALFELTNYFATGNYSLRVDFNATFNYYYMPFPLILSGFANFSYSAVGQNNLTVEDPTDITINFMIEGEHRPETYPSGSLPGIYKRGENATFEVWIEYQSNPVTSGTVQLIDVYNSYNVIDSYTYNAGDVNGYHKFLINTSTANLHAGLHYIEVRYSLKSNFTYIIINETISSISIDQPEFEKQRDTTGFTISGTVQDTITLKGLKVKIFLLNKSNMTDVSGYLDLVGPQTITISDAGYYSFTINEITIACPRGEYYILITFNGSIYHTDGLLSIDMTNAMVSTNSSLLSINVTAGVNIIEGYYYTEKQSPPYELCINTDILHVIGNLTWDDGSPMVNVKVTLRVLLALDDSPIAANYTATTDINGSFDATLVIDASWPDYFSETKIIIEFSSALNNLEYVIDPSSVQYN